MTPTILVASLTWMLSPVPEVPQADVPGAAAGRLEAGRRLLEEGIEGLQEVFRAAGVPPLTFNQETQVRGVYDAHRRALEELIAGNGGSRAGVETAIEEIADQLLLAALKFLNPSQRTALTGSVAADAFADLNSDLPEDEAELVEYLADLRSPAATGGGILIDGFSGGRTPNRDEIQEIRINENAFTAEQSSQTRGRTEIVTRGGVGRFNGDVTFDFADESLDARNVFARTRPPYQRRNLRLNLSGPVIRDRLTATFSYRRNESEDGDTLRAITPAGLIDDAITRPASQREYTTRATMQLSGNNVLNLSYTWGNQDGENQNVGGFRLPEQGLTRLRDNFNFQIKETAVLSTRWNHEARFQVNEFTEERRPVSPAVHINVLDAFRGGGGTQETQFERREYEFGNLLMFTGSRLALRMGYDGRYEQIDSNTRQNFNGTFTCASLDDFAARRPILFTVNQGDPRQEVTQLESATFIQGDWRVRPDLTLFMGARYEWQQNLDDGNNLAPRFGFAYSVGPDTVLRGGTGIFHQRFQASVLNNLRRFDGMRQQSIVIRNPSYPDPLAGGTGDAAGSDFEVRVAAGELTAPYTWNSEVSLETTLAGSFVLTGSYRFVRGVHLLRSRNLNAPYDVTSIMPRSCRTGQNPAECRRPDPARGNINQLESTGTSRSHIVRIGFRQRMSFLNLNGSYVFDSTYDDIPGGDSFALPADNFDLGSEWGPSSARHRYNTSVSLRLPWNVNTNTIFNWSSGEPFSLRTGTDDNQDTSTNDRPAGVGRNSRTGPEFFEIGMSLSKSVTLRSDRIEAEGDSRPGAGPVGSDGFYGQRTGLRMTLEAQVDNLLNKVNFQTISGVLTSPFFGLPTRARDGRRVRLSVRFDF